jgi:hypothetical protein
VRLTDHAAWRAERRGIGRHLIEALVLEAHEQRRVNKGGAAAWMHISHRAQPRRVRPR